MTRRATRASDQITIRVDPEVGKRLRGAAERENTSVSRIVDRALRVAVGVDTEQRTDPLDRIGHRLDWMAGTMSEAEANELLDRLRMHERIDEDLWAPASRATRTKTKKRAR